MGSENTMNRNLPPPNVSDQPCHQTDQYENPFHLHDNDHAGLSRMMLLEYMILNSVLARLNKVLWIFQHIILNYSLYGKNIRTIWIFQFLLVEDVSVMLLLNGKRYNMSGVTKFLMGLNECYEQTRRHILMLKPIPTIEEAFNIVTQDERQKTIRPTSRVDNVVFQASAPVMEYAKTSYIAAYNTIQPNQKLICSHCGKVGHTVQKCFKLHGFPPGYKTNANYKNNNQSQFQWRMKMSQVQPRMQQPAVAQMQMTQPQMQNA